MKKQYSLKSNPHILEKKFSELNALDKLQLKTTSLNSEKIHVTLRSEENIDERQCEQI
jgi:hypothetical protein